MLYALFTHWFLLLHLQIICLTVGLYLESYQDIIYKDFIATTASNDFSNRTISVEDSTESYRKVAIAKSSSDDVIELNVGGEKIATLRSTLMAVPNSKLALMFTKDNQTIWKPKDNHGTIFFDYNPAQFKYLLDQLRMIKRKPDIAPYEINFEAPDIYTKLNFTHMIVDLGLNPEQFLSPLVDVHRNLNISSLIGWRECYRKTYHVPFDISVLREFCKAKRILVACHPVDNKETLTLAAVGQWEDLLHPCLSSSHCNVKITNGTSFYYVADQAWGFRGYSKNSVPNPNFNPYQHQYRTSPQNSLYLNPCDSSDEDSEYRLCWSVRSNTNRGGGDRCGNVKNLHNAFDWERVIYQAV